MDTSSLPGPHRPFSRPELQKLDAAQRVVMHSPLLSLGLGESQWVEFWSIGWSVYTQVGETSQGCDGAGQGKFGLTVGWIVFYPLLCKCLEWACRESSNYQILQLLRFLKTFLTCFIVTFNLFWWSRTKTTISPRYAYAEIRWINNPIAASVFKLKDCCFMSLILRISL